MLFVVRQTIPYSIDTYPNSQVQDIYLIVWVDVIVIPCCDEMRLESINWNIFDHFQTKDLGHLKYFLVLRWLNLPLVLQYPRRCALVCGQQSHGSKRQTCVGQKSHCTYFFVVLLIYDKYVLYCDRQWNTLNKRFLNRLLSLTTLIFITSKWWSNMVLFSLFKL